MLSDPLRVKGILPGGRDNMDQRAIVDIPEPVADRRWHRALMFGVRLRAWAFGGVFTAGSACLVFSGSGELLLVKQRYRQGWGLPGGFMRSNEQPGDTVLRELAEEVGIIQVDPTFVAAYRAPRRLHLEYLYWTEVADHELPSDSSWEIVKADWFRLGALPPVQREVTEALRRWIATPNGRNRFHNGGNLGRVSEDR